jgi:hypothetical protein
MLDEKLGPLSQLLHSFALVDEGANQAEPHDRNTNVVCPMVDLRPIANNVNMNC